MVREPRHVGDKQSPIEGNRRGRRPEHCEGSGIRAYGLSFHDRIVLASDAAEDRGVLRGMTLAAARAVCAELEVRSWADTIIARAVNTVSLALLEVSPQVTPSSPGIWWVGVDGLGGIVSERALLRRLRSIARRWSSAAAVSIADSCVAARVASFHRRSDMRIVPPGQDRDFLALAPLALLPTDAETRETLLALGFSTAGQLAALDPGDVESRFGPEGLAAWRLARGEDRRRPALARVPARHEAVAELHAPTTTMEPVLFLLRGMLDRMVREVMREGKAVREMEVEIQLDKGGDDGKDGKVGKDGKSGMRGKADLSDLSVFSDLSVRLTLPRPLARTAPLLEHVRAALERTTFTAPILGVRLRITELDTPAGEQGDLLQLGWRDPAAADAALARLRSTLGAQAVVRPVALDAHAPERRGVWQEDETGGGRSKVEGRLAPTIFAPPGSDPLTQFRLLNPPEPIDIDPAAAAFVWRGRPWIVTEKSAPERLSGEWWKASYARDYYCWIGDGVRFLVFQNEERWWLQGWWD